MENARILIRKRLAQAIRSYNNHLNDDYSFRLSIASMWSNDCDGYITAMMDAGLITFDEWMHYEALNQLIYQKIK